MDGEFCVVCGRTDTDLIEGLCADCAAKRTQLLTAPSRARVTLCPTCGARGVGAHWERAGSELTLTKADLDPFLVVHPEVGVRSVDWSETGANALEHRFEATARVRFRGSERTVELPMTVKVEHRTCPECSRRSGHYYTAVIQLRSAIDDPREKSVQMHERLDRAWSKLLKESREDWRRSVSWREARPEGWDFFVVDTLAARGIARLARQRLGASIKESATLVGRKEGEDLYRVTFCLRVPAARPPGPVPDRRRARAVEQYS